MGRPLQDESLMLRRLYRLARRLARPVHPNRLRYYLLYSADRLGIRPAFRRLGAGALSPRRVAATWRWARGIAAAHRRRRREPRLTVAVDVTAFWEPLTGIGWYLYRLLEHLADRDDVRLRLYGPHLVDTPDVPPPAVALPGGPAIEEVTYRVPEDLSLDRGWAAGWLRRRDARLIAADRNLVMFAPNYFLPPWFDRCRGRLVATVHDLSFRRVPWTLRETTREDLAQHLERTMARAARVLTDSETVLGELLESGLADPARAHAVPLGPGPVAAAHDAAPPPAATPERYVLHVGTLEPRKNLPTLLAAWRLLRARGAEPPPLVFCGRFGWKTEELRREMAAAVDEGWLRHLGYAADGEVAALYRHALAVALPSIYEGFGLPAVEAMYAGAPLVMSDIPVLREVGGDAALFVPPDDPGAWADAMERVLGDAELRRDLAARGRARREAFDWRRTAESTVAVWKAAAGLGEVGQVGPVGPVRPVRLV